MPSTQSLQLEKEGYREASLPQRVLPHDHRRLIHSKTRNTAPHIITGLFESVEYLPVRVKTPDTLLIQEVPDGCAALLPLHARLVSSFGTERSHSQSQEAP